MVNKIRYWAFEGNEGTGKTVLSKSFAETCSAIWTYEPNAETEDLRHLREMALDNSKPIPNHAREMCLLANRSIHHSTFIQPLLANLDTVITDRSILSGMVYAKIATYSFEEWVELSKTVHLFTFPDVIVYCTSNKRKMNNKKEGRENDIYDNATSEVIESIDTIYEEAIAFMQEHKLMKQIKIIRFENDFNLPVEDNLSRLIDLIKIELDEEHD